MREKKQVNKMFNLKKNYILVITGIILVGIILLAIYFGTDNNSKSYTIEIIGDNSVVVYKGDKYVDPGAKAYDDQNNDLSVEISVDSNLNINKIGRYEILYKIDDIYVKRIVRVIEKTNNISDGANSGESNGETIIKLKGNKTIYLDLYGVYTEEGFSAVDSVDGDISKKVKVTQNVDNTKPGTYQVVYTVKNSAGVTTSIARNIIVMSIDLKLSVNNSSYTNEKVLINVSVNDEYFNYLILPNGEKITSKNYVYSVSDNGTYKFTLYNKYGVVKEKSITVNNIDRVIPKGSCNGFYQSGTSTINVVANDNIGISKYIVNGVTYTSSTIKINQELANVNVDIYDKAGNKNTVSCSLINKNITSDKSITFSYKFITDNSNLSYGLYTPSTASSNDKIPLIIWLHGSGTVGASKDNFKSNFLSFMKNWKLEGFNAYIVCPLLSSGTWNKQKTKTKVYTLIDKIISEKNIDTNKIILAGHSLGAQGIYNIADGKLDYYSALVFLSPYKQSPSSIDITQFKNIPLRGYVGTIEAGEDSLSYSHATKDFSNTFGKDKLVILNTRHGTVPNVAFTTDSNNDNKSDLIEWMLSQ